MQLWRMQKKQNKTKQNKDDFMLLCSKFKTLIHYECKGLPLYQVALFLQKGYRLFQCKRCVGEIHPNILEYMDEIAERTEINHAALKRRKNELEWLVDEKIKQKQY